METLDIVLMLVALTLGTQIPRFLPLILPRSWLVNPMLQKLNKVLPLVIMLLLVLTSLNFSGPNSDLLLLLAQIFALVCVIFSYKWFGNILLSVALGILSINAFFFLSVFLWLCGL